jgi:REP element-mobilizing transposase RayT
MAVRTIHLENDQVYFCTITCYNWLNLIQLTDFYNEIYKWFDILVLKDCKILGYVLMPNHFHFLIYIPETNVNLNKLVANGKRFMAYEIISRLKKQENFQILKILQSAVSENDRLKGQLHYGFVTSFDAKICESEKFILQKLDYMHANPVTGKWNLVEDFTDYIHSSAKYYELNEEGIYPVTHYNEIIG